MGKVKNDMDGTPSFLSNTVKGECTQITASGVVTTKGMKSTAPYLDHPNSADTRFHLPSYGVANKKF